MNPWCFFLASLVSSTVVVPINSVLADQLTTVTIITSNQRPVNISGVWSFDIEILNFDSVKAFEMKLSEDLPANEQQAKTIVEKRIAEVGQAALNAQVHHAYRALSVSMQYEITHYPAIIFDGQALVVGVSDLSVALAKYYQWQQKMELGDE